MTQDEVKYQILRKLNGRDNVRIVGHDEELAQLESLIEDTIANDEGNSCMVLGPRSSGKSTLVFNALDNLEDKYKDQFLLVNLSGAAQLDDKMALREISRQLDAHIDQNEGTIEERALRETLFQILETFQQSEHSKPVIFILDELDRFARHPRQTLLYNLLELVQTSKVGISMIGISCRMNAREMLEKRVLSRFSQRVYQVRKAETLDEFWEIAKVNLFSDDSSPEGNAWNDHLEVMFQNTDAALRQLVEYIFYTTKDIRQLCNALVYPVSLANPFVSASDIIPPEPISHSLLFVEGLSELELGLLICASRVEHKLESDTLNFNLAYDEYVSQGKKLNQERRAATSGIAGGIKFGRYRIWSRQAAMAAWERLESIPLIVPVTTSRAAEAMYKVDITLLELGEAIGASHTLYSWTRL